MKSRIWLEAAVVAASFVYGGGAMAQSASPTAVPTPAPLACSVTNLPDGSAPECDTGAEEPPSFLGVSGGNYNSVATDKSGTTTCGTGTFGALVQDSSENSYVLSTNHILARNSGTKGSAAMNEVIVQPGLEDLGCWQDPTDTVAALSKWTPLNFAKGTNLMDAALGKVVTAQVGPSGPSVPGIDPMGEIFNMGGGHGGLVALPGQISATPFDFNNLVDGTPVVKMGRTSCLTAGRIDAFDAMGAVIYPGVANAAASGTAFFEHQILVLGQDLGSTSGGTCDFADAGDSGALVMTADFSCPQAIGMVFAATGPPASPEAGGVIVAATPIQTILDKFKVTLVGKECSAPSEPTSSPVTFSNLGAPTPISDAKRASIEQVRKVKDAHGLQLLRHHAEIAAIGIGAGDDSDSANLNVYLRSDTPKIRRQIQAALKGAKINWKHVGRLHPL